MLLPTQNRITSAVGILCQIEQAYMMYYTIDTAAVAKLQISNVPVCIKNHENGHDSLMIDSVMIW